ncbi:uncharacterized protein [Nicotiana tomentosiformis]|uniref:uncharacterized protein n=1 Tax=Nicotiana tomentosiformis TaxID=4098 RepID=UPI00388CC569
MKHVFIDFDNLDDHNAVATRSFVNLGGDFVMSLEKWITKFKPEPNTTRVPVWITLPDLPWHFYEWDAICRIVDPIGFSLVLDKATTIKTRPTTAKIRIEIDLAKPILNEVIIEIRNLEGNIEEFIQKVEYESLPNFTSRLRVQNNSEVNEQTKRNDTNQNENVRAVRRNEHRREQGRPQNAGQTNGNSNAAVKSTGNRPANNNSVTNIDKGAEDGWHIVNKRNNRNDANNNHASMTTQRGMILTPLP